MAVVALMAGGTIAAGIAVEAERNGGPGSTEAAAAAEPAIGQSPGWTGVLRPVAISSKDGPGRPGADLGRGETGRNDPGSRDRPVFEDDSRSRTTTQRLRTAVKTTRRAATTTDPPPASTERTQFAVRSRDFGAPGGSEVHSHRRTLGSRAVNKSTGPRGGTRKGNL